MVDQEGKMYLFEELKITKKKKEEEED